jgi:sugar phosphate permease
VLAPALRDEFGLDLSDIGVVLAAEWIGLTLVLLPWGLVVDRLGERWMVPAGLAVCGGFMAAAAHAPGFGSLVVLLALAGAAGGSVQSGSGRAVMGWFGSEERGLALGVRQTAVPLGGLIAAVALPLLGGVRESLLFLAAFCFVGALVAASILREGAHEELDTATVERTLRDGRLWRLCFGSGLYLIAQVAIIGFVVLFLHDERGVSTGAAAAVLASSQALAVVARIAAGRWSDRLRARVIPLRHVGIASFAAVALVALFVDAPLLLLVPLLALTGALSMSWNGLSYTAAAEFAGRARSGAAIGFQQTVLSLIGVGAPVAFALAVAASSWQIAFALAALFPLAGWWFLAPLRERPTRVGSE